MQYNHSIFLQSIFTTPVVSVKVKKMKLQGKVFCGWTKGAKIHNPQSIMKSWWNTHNQQVYQTSFMWNFYSDNDTRTFRRFVIFVTAFFVRAIQTTFSGQTIHLPSGFAVATYAPKYIARASNK